MSMRKENIQNALTFSNTYAIDCNPDISWPIHLEKLSYCFITNIIGVDRYFI